MPPERPQHGGYPDEQTRFTIPASLIICNDILPLQEQADLTQAALLCHQGYDLDAERSRYFAGYSNVGFRDDADVA